PPLYPRADGLHAGAGSTRAAADHHFGPGAAAGQRLCRLRLRAALPEGAAGVPSRTAPAAERRSGARGALPLSGRREGARMTQSALLEVDDLHTSFAVRRGGRAMRVPAVDGVSLSLGRGEVLGIVGESG